MDDRDLAEKILRVVSKTVCDAAACIETGDMRRVKLTTLDDGSQVSTMMITDCPEFPYETAVICEEYNDGKVLPVEAYATVEEAKAGHEKWTKMMDPKNRPDSITDGSKAPIKQLIIELGCDPNYFIYKRIKKGGK